MINSLIENIKYINNFGILFSFKLYFFRKIVDYDKIHNLILKKIEKEFNSVVINDLVDDKMVDKKLCNNKVWVLWWQGDKNMPPIVDLCIKNMYNVIKNKDIIFITKDNFQKYVELPDYIINKFNRKQITMQTFSDIIRCYLLYYYGGTWIDSTVFMTKDLDENIFDYDFYTIKRDINSNEFISNNKWTSFFLFAKRNNILFKNVLNMYYNYWRKYNMTIDYFLTDYFFYYLYSKNSFIKNMIDKIPINNTFVHGIYAAKPYNKKEIEKFMQNTYLYKLSWKDRIDYEDMKNNYNYLKRISKIS